MVVRESNTLFLEILDATAVAGVPIELDVYDGADPQTMLATLENAYGRQFQSVLSDLGAGQFSLNRNDPKNTAAIIRQGNLVKAKIGGVYRFAWFMDDIADVPLTPGEGADQSITVSGRGPAAILDRAIVYPPVYPPATIRRVGSTEVSNGGATTIVVTRPTGTKVGDVIYVAITTTGGSDADIDPPGSGQGWAEIERTNADTSLAVAVFRKRVTAANNAPSSVFSLDASRNAAAIALTFRGVNKDGATFQQASQENASSVNIKAPTLTPDLVNSRLVVFAATRDGTAITPPGGYTEVRDIAAGGLVTLEASDRSNGTSLDPTGVVTAVAGTAAKNVGVHVLMAPSSESAANYSGLTWGAILDDQLTEAQDRGALADLTYDFDATVDSHGQPWVDTPVIGFPAGTPVLDVWRQATAMGLDSLVTHDLKLQVWEDYSRTRTDVVFRAGYHLTDKVEKRLTEHGMKSRLLVEGAGGLYFEVSDPAIEANPYVGRREGFLSFTNAADPTTMQRGGQATLTTLAAEGESLSLPVRHGLGAGQYEPWVDYREGDWITLDVPGTYDLVPFRIVSITVSEAGPDYDVVLDLNSMTLEYLAKVKRMLDQLGGAQGSATGSAAGALSAAVTAGPSAAGAGKVQAAIGDTAGYLYDKVAAGAGVTKALVGEAGSQQLQLSAAGAANLDALTDVDVSTTPPTDGQALIYDLASTLWKPGAGAGGGAGVTPHHATVYQAAGQSVGNGVYTPDWTYLSFAGATPQVNQGAMFASGAPDRLTFQRAGTFDIKGGWAHNGTNATATDTIMGLNLYSAAGVLVATVAEARYFGIFECANTITAQVTVTAGQYVRVFVYQTTGGTRTTNTGMSFLAAHEIVASGGGAAATSFDLTATGTTWLDASATTTNRSTDDYLRLAEASGFYKFPVLRFDLSSLAGKKLANCRLRLVTRGDGSAGFNGSIFTGFIGIKRVLKPVNTATATWVNYDTGLAWAGSGVNSTDADAGTGAVIAWLSASNGQDGQVLVVDMMAPIQEAIDAGRTTDAFIMRCSGTTGGGGNAIMFGSLAFATVASRPRLIGAYL